MEAFELIKEVRESLNLNQSDFAKALNTTQQEISKLETGNCKIKIDLLIKISRLLKMPLCLSISADSLNRIPPSSLKLLESLESLRENDQKIIIDLIHRLQ